MADYKLVLHPVDPWAILQDPVQLKDALRGIGFLGAGFSHVGELHYRAGTRLLELVRFKPGATCDDGACHISLLETVEAPVFLGASNAQGTQCPGCQGKVANWKEQLLAWQQERSRYQWRCPKCSKGLKVENLDWGSTGGLARYSLDVWGVPENAAVPSEELLAFLERETFQVWRYFYYRF
jgi:hypothetical protein